MSKKKIGMRMEVADEHGSALTRLDAKIKTRIEAQFANLLERNWTEIRAAMNSAAVEAGRHEKDTFEYPVAVKIAMEPRGDECGVRVAIAYGVKHSDETEQALVGAPELPGLETEKANK